MEPIPRSDAQDRRPPTAGSSDALDGYPVAELFQLCREAERPAHAVLLARRLLATWISRLTHDIEFIKLPAPDALARARRHMVESRDALVQVLASLSRLDAELALPGGPATASWH